MMSAQINKEKLCGYIENQEVVYQIGDCLVEVAHGRKTKKSLALSSIVRNSSRVEYAEFDEMKDDFPDLVDWGVEELDALIFVKYDVLICIPKKSMCKIQ